MTIDLADVLTQAAAPGNVEAARLLDDLEREDSTLPPAARARLLDVRGAMESTAGRFAEALAAYDDAANLRADDSGEPGRAVHKRRRAQALLALGRFAEAEAEFRDALAGGAGTGPRLRALILLDLAVLEIARGRYDAAETALREARGLLAGLRGLRSARDWARYHDTHGTLHRVRGERRRAAEEHAEALALLDAASGFDGEQWGGAERANALMNLAIDHLLERSVRYTREGARLLGEARAVLDRLVGRDAETARCAANLGIALALLDERHAAGESLREASLHYRLAGRALEHATVDHNRACLLAFDPDAADDTLHDALDLIVPAAIVRDAARFDVRDGDNRRRWWAGQARTSYAEALAIAARLNAGRSEPTLIADLIISFRLSGLVGVESAAVVSADRLSDVLLLDREPADIERDPTPELLRPILSPRVVGAGGREVLAGYLAIAATRYRTIGSLRSGRVAFLR